ncbi:hypothetical protein Dda_5781 [Drechslerella dactyloides]|uniref:Uncharacterized protein n=1 Tax=Drechslerella dactyloides TaxID=74499 RepID=A0AAD6IYI1_DREDA|nr:hypothetical protein Dda_5781 [Drechslerella dactyloides]
MAGPAEWSRNGADNADSEQFAADAQLRFIQQSDPDNLLKAPRHYIPVFVLHSFCKSERPRPFVLPDSERVAKIKTQLVAQRKLTAACPSWDLVSKGSDIVDNETFIIFDTRTKRFTKYHWTECFKFEEPYQKFFEKFTMKEFTREGWKFHKFEKLQRVDLGIMKGLWTNTYKVYEAMETRRRESSDFITLKRSDVWEFRKYLFLMTFLRNRDRNTHLLGTSEAMFEAKERRTTFMGVHNLNHPRDLWLHNASIMLDTPHHQVSYHKMLFDLDQEDYRTNARERFMVFWEAGPDDEFILTDSSFGGMEIGRLEAKHTMPKRLKPSDLQKRLYSRDFMWHQIFVLSPKLAVALCHGTMINSTLIREHRDRFGLRLSLLDKLPHPLAQGYYKDLHVKECRFLKPEWKIPGEVEELFGRPADKGKYVANLDARANNDLEFMVSTLSSAQVALVNMVLLQNQSVTTAVENVVYRNPAALYRAIEEYGKHDWVIFTDEKQHSYKSLKRKIFNQFNKPANGHDSGKSSSGSSDPGTRSSGSSSRHSEKKSVTSDKSASSKPYSDASAARSAKQGRRDQRANPFYSDSEPSDDDDDFLPPMPSSTMRQRSPSPVRIPDLPMKREEPVVVPPPKPVETPAPPKINSEPPKMNGEASKPVVEAPVRPPIPTTEPPKEKAAPVPEPPKPVADPIINKAAPSDRADKVKSPDMERLEKEMAEKERVLREEQEAIQKLRREKQELEAELELRRKEEAEASARMERKKSERGGRPEDRNQENRERARSENRERDDRVRATSTKSADNRRRPRSKDRAEAELVDVGKQLALLEMEREKVRKEKLELEEMQVRRRREEEKENQKKFDRLQKDLAYLQRQLEEERQEKEKVKRIAAKEKEILKSQADALVRQTRELREAQERDQARAEVERAARAEKERLDRLEKERIAIEKERVRDLERQKDRELKKRQERERIMIEKEKQERLQRDREIQADKEKEAERAKRHRDREQERAARNKNRQSRYDLYDRASDVSDELDAQALFRKNRMMLGAMSPTSDTSPVHLRHDEMTPPSSSHSHPDQFDDRRFEPMRSQSPPSPRLGYQFPPSPRRADTSPVPLGSAANHRRGAQPKMLALEFESPPSSGFQTSPVSDSSGPPLDLALYAPPKEKSSRRKPDGHARDARDPHAREQPRDPRAPPAHVRRFEPPAPLPNFNDLDRRLSKIPTTFPREEFPAITHNERYPEDDYDDDDYGNGYGEAVTRYERAPKKRLQIEAPPAPPKGQYPRQKPPPRALPPPDYRNGR